MSNDTIALIVIILLTLNLLFVGFYIVLVLKEVRQAARRINSILESADNIVSSFSKPFVEASGILIGLTKGLEIVNSLRRKKREEEDDK